MTPTSNQSILLSFVYITLTFLGFYLAYLYGRKTKQFIWKEYLAIMFLPTILIFLLVYFYGIKILALFLISSFSGFFLEYIFGLTYHKTLNKRLWEYKKFSVNGYTSLLVIPVWGIAGIYFFMLAKMIGI